MATIFETSEGTKRTPAAAGTARSCIYEGRVTHLRRWPVEHRISFDLFMMYLDLDELPELFDRRWLWSARGAAVASFRREDHFGDPREDLATSVRDLVERRTGRRPAGPIRLLTHLRYLGYVFNPISVFYCFSEDGRRVESVVAEVTSTPWKERHCYVLEAESIAGQHARGGLLRAAERKRLHVSPFMDMDVTHEFALSAPGSRLTVEITNRTQAGRGFSAQLAMLRRPMTSGALARVLLRYPLMTMQVIAAIYLHALRLRLKGLRYHPPPGTVPDDVARGNRALERATRQ